MDNILSKKHYRRSFFTVVTLVLVLAFFVRFIGVPHFDSNAKVDLTTFAVSILDTLTVSLLITVFIGSFVFWLTPEIIKKSTMDVIEPKEINPLFKKAAADTKTWIIKGACGRYTRAVTIPSLAQSAKHEGIGRDIRIIMLDPAEMDTCEEYANYRRSLKSASTRGPWTKEKVQEEVIATVPDINANGGVEMVDKPQEAIEILHGQFHESYTDTFSDLAGTIDLDLIAIGTLSLLFFVGILSALKKKDSIPRRKER